MPVPVEDVVVVVEDVVVVVEEVVALLEVVVVVVVVGTAVLFNWYISSLLPAPQYSVGFPGHAKLQSP